MEVENLIYLSVKGHEEINRISLRGNRLINELVHLGIVSVPCAGGGRCGKCLVRTFTDNVPISQADRLHLPPASLEEGLRLACQIDVESIKTDARGEKHLILERVEHHETMQVLTHFDSMQSTFAPTVTRLVVPLDRPSLTSPLSAWKRLALRLPFEIEPTPDLLRQLVTSLENGDVLQIICGTHPMKKMTEVFRIGSEKEELAMLGIAVDIGTTTLALYLYDLSDGRQLGHTSARNAGAQYGSDVISRINVTINDPTMIPRFQFLLVDQIQSLANELLADEGYTTSDVYDVVLAANTTMFHQLLGLPAASLASAPFSPILNEGMLVSADTLGFTFNGYVRLMPGLAAYVGADVVAGLLMDMGDKPTLYLDLGTNGEICLIDGEDIVALATAAGPAFEGQNISCGVASIPGAITDVRLSDDVALFTLADKAPLGICGTGVIAMVAELLRCGAVDETGRLLPRHEFAERHGASLKDESIAERLIGDKNDVYFHLTNDLRFTAKDVREVQLAKAAIRAGIEVLLKDRGMTVDQIKRVVIAGGFGHYLPLEHAFAIQLLPEIWQGRVISIGNGAGYGASRTLLDYHMWVQAIDVSDRTQYIELSCHTEFSDFFMEHMTFEAASNG